MRLTYKKKTIKLEEDGGFIVVSFYVKEKLKYKEKLSTRQFKRFVNNVIEEKDGKVGSIKIINIDKFVNFRVNKKNIMMSLFFPKPSLRKMLRIYGGMLGVVGR